MGEYTEYNRSEGAITVQKSKASLIQTKSPYKKQLKCFMPFPASITMETSKLKNNA